ncbi:hypothetical protein BofuT4_P065280.1 [Botrytis cinerea T4]|uniref:HTH CENPB-type domain-containing protein n=1 Tax=Botryotinia fuckeliana (strain T4) TaxID=999810 RepID=G2XRX0_BOTF4|nr:hypothetical protein BofuT4_P065280.1 [Botrytis cinerea T4]
MLKSLTDHRYQRNARNEPQLNLFVRSNFLAMTKPYTEDDIAAALFAIAGGMSMRKACSEYGIPRTTLHNRINGHLSHKKGAQNLQKIAPVQERALANWILVQEALGTSPTHRQIRELGESILNLEGGDLSLGKRWIHSFLERNPEIKTKRQYKIDNARINGATTEIISKFF